jgi:large repetitive protein
MNPSKTAFMNVDLLFLSIRKKWKNCFNPGFLLGGAFFLSIMFFSVASYASPGDRSFSPTDSIGFTGSTTICQGQSLLLTANFAPAGSTFVWQISTDGGANWFNVGVNPTYNATTTGLYTVVVFIAGVPTNWPVVNITVNPVPLADYTFTPNSSCSSIDVAFTNTSTGAISYEWNFGDPNSGALNTSTLASPTHHFAGSHLGGTQTFNVTLIATNNFGCKDTITKVVTTTSPGTLLGGTGFTIYNGQPYFSQCASAASVFTFSNQSTTTNTEYIIKWGDGSPDFVATTFTSTIQHSYAIGSHAMQFIVTGQNGCKDTAYYYVYVGGNPSVGLNNPGNTIICAGTSITFPITLTSGNPPGTEYTVIYSDGSPPTFFTQPPPSSITHTFNVGSCGFNTPSYQNSHMLTIRATNPCSASGSIAEAIFVSSKGVTRLHVTPHDTVCVNTTVAFTNGSTNGYGVTSTGQCLPAKGVWKVTPATGWSLVSGNMGNDFGLADPSVWANGSTSINLNFTIAGTYSIKLKTGSTSTCGPDSIIRTICVNPAPVAAFSLDANAGCAPFTVNTTNNSNTPLCGANTYQWTVSYSNTSGCTPAVANYIYLNGTSSTSAQPQFQFINPGVYTISLVTRNSNGVCSSSPVSQTVTVKAKPVVALNAPQGACQNTSINPTATVNNCYSSTASTYSWSFTGGNPSSSTTAVPGPIQYTTSGTHTITLSVTNECGTTIVTQSIVISPAPDVVVPSNIVLCAGSPTGMITFSSAVGGVTYNWTNSNTAIGLAASGAGNIASFNAVNSSNAPITGIITVTPTAGCPGPSASFSITVNPRPSAPVVVSPVYCLNQVAAPLNATATGGNTLTWYNNPGLTGGTTTVPVPSTSTAGVFNWYVTQLNSFNCESAPAILAVTVLPAIANNIIASDQTICTGSVPVALTGNAVSGGNGSFNYQWQSSPDGINWSVVPGASSAGYAPPVLNATIYYRRIVTSNSCSDTSNTVTITAQGTLSNIDIGIAQTICEGTIPSQLTGQTPAGGNGTFSYQWESSANNTNWTTIAGATASDYQPPVLTQSTYFRRRTSSGSCSSYSSSVLITVNPKPVMSFIADGTYCNNSPVNNITFASTPSSNVAYAWTNDNTSIGLAASGNGNLPVFAATNTSNPGLPLTGTITVIPTYTNNAVSCAGNPLSFRIIALPVISVAPVPDTSLCTSLTMPLYNPVHNAASFAGSTVSYNWNVSGSGITLANGSGNAIPGYSTFNPGTTDLTAIVTITPVYHFNNVNCTGIPESYTVTVKPGTPLANAGRDTSLCNLTSYTMQGNLPAGTSGQWSQIGNPAAGITNATSPVTPVTGLIPGNTYSFVWTLSGFASCPDTKDTIVIRVDPEVVNTINNNIQTICAGQSVTITGNAASGGNGVYQYQWQSSADNVNWTDMPGETTVSLTFSPMQTTYVRRVVRSLPCFKESISTQIIVQPALTNNIIAANQDICINTDAALITGSVPVGGNNNFLHQWQSSPDAVIWSDIPAATTQNYDPPVLTVTTYYRRLVSTSLCSGPQSNVSNIITIVVRPDAKAQFQPAGPFGCAPFAITPSIINLSTFPAQNGDYVWYADNNFIGNGSTFPGYTISLDGDSVVIKLIAVSAFGCKNDSMSYKFYTYRVPRPSFTLSDTVGCGPLSVLITNTTPDAGQFSFEWDLGNGITTTAIQPGTVVFQPNPTYSDTTYIVRLKVFSPCDTIIISKSIRVKSKPRALFTPNNAVGCSPMRVVFNNTSAGLNVTYTWNFGDGSAPFTTTSKDTVGHIFYTAVRDTFYVKLIAVNECGTDSLTYAIVVSPNTIFLDFAVNGNEQSGCSPHTVHFINNSAGASAFTWDFGDGTIINTVKNIDTVAHTYLLPGTYVVTLRGTNGCSDTSATEMIIVYPKPVAGFSANLYTVCLGDSVRFTNLSTGATSYLWQFGDGLTSVLTHPVHTYTTAGIYTVQLITYRFNAPGSVCTDTTSQQVQIVPVQPGWFTASDTASTCAPLTVTFTNMNVPSVTAAWDFGDGTTGNGNVVTHTFTAAGTYIVKLTVVVPGGCTYITTREVKILGPSGTFSYTSGFICNDRAAVLQVNAMNTDTLIYNFGDGITLTTTSNQVFHSYINAGLYVPSVRLKNTGGCVVPLAGTDTIKVDKIKAGFTSVIQRNCGNTLVSLTDTSHAFFGKSLAKWDFGDGTYGTGFTVNHTYQSGGIYSIQLIVFGNSGCSDTITKQLTIHVNNIPEAAIQSASNGCTDQPVLFTGSIQSTDAINIVQWNVSNGASGVSNPFSYAFNQPGNYTVQLIVRTVNGCYDTVSKSIAVALSPTITVSGSQTICRGNSVQLNVAGAGAVQYAWTPALGLTCTNCPNPMASPATTTAYIAQVTNIFGCSVTDTVVVTVIPPLHLNVSPADSICIGQSAQLVASGAAGYSWSPATGLSNTTISNPVATPANTIVYRVVGHDGFNCFSDTAYVTVAVGKYPDVDLGPDLVLSTGTLHPLNTIITNGPIRNWLWTPSTDLSCATCSLPIANIKKDITYSVKVTTAYGCSASDTIFIKTFCTESQVFIPNAFTPDGDGINDVFMVRAKGIVSVKSFRIFNRWGEVVFEKDNFPPNNPAYGWKGKVNAVETGPEVYVYTAEVVCENGSVYTYKGNVSILK